MRSECVVAGRFEPRAIFSARPNLQHVQVDLTPASRRCAYYALMASIILKPTNFQYGLHAKL